ncbi:MAG: hypothetical protein OXF11_05590 [Deltaproteobacteria bacterium]|nr:hypothetical protein [Deltaproteobacteria bacterium]
MILVTARKHFDEDKQRARLLTSHASDLEQGLLKDDVLRSAWMIAVGASDAYFCDAYADLVARTLRAKDSEPNIELPHRLGSLQVPVTAVIRESSGWRWRMAARGLMERENVLSIDRIKELFNHFFDEQRKLMNPTTIEPWILHKDSRQRLWGFSKTTYRRGNDKPAACRAAVRKFGERMSNIFQRRHDCIHNCDRPKAALQQTSVAGVKKAIEDIEFLVNRCHEAFVNEFPEYIGRCGFSGATKNAVT